jgi:hypothetical protein
VLELHHGIGVGYGLRPKKLGYVVEQELGGIEHNQYLGRDGFGQGLASLIGYDSGDCVFLVAKKLLKAMDNFHALGNRRL